MDRPYYSQRAGKVKNGLSLDELKQGFLAFYNDFDRDGYFQQHLGYQCVDRGFVPGLAGKELHIDLLVALRKTNLWPFEDTIASWTEDDLFDVVEYLYDRVSMPKSGNYHDYDNCGWHYYKFDQAQGRASYRARMNRVLGAYDEGFELSETGEVLSLADEGLKPLLEAEFPAITPENVRGPMLAAIRKFRRHRATAEDKLGAIRDLAAALEFIRPQVKHFFDKDESDMFNLANNFAIRHNNGKQKERYDNEIWYSWMFNYYLATLHATLRMIARQDQA
ncbi:hypothetical protein AUC43_15380 [Hymenobacter sedentarius]|uniref:Uncharacterized protein n=1 Tax=Hymenobacter sedentarius TaxID=1411621 RepID=A0A0U4CDW5_9BACT|nr:hypothetical protein [Hymenobacter sedentarius]ALW86345.1 hypothetical protein AUC43_15380 [Hymenobacter sedentarius]